jgi:phthalate 4,5-cis-dihydrodiol dehydrogenase
LDTTRGGGAVFIQGPHSVDIVRLIGGGMVRSVRAMTGIANKNRPTEGHYIVYMEFEDGTPATIVYNGYAHFDTAELHYWVGESGRPRDPEVNFRARKIIKGLNREEEANLKESLRFGGGPDGEWVYRSYRGDPNANKRQPFFGMSIVSCEHGDIRQSPDGIYIYGNDGKTELIVPSSIEERETEIEEMYTAIANDRPVFHDGRWGQATLEVCLAIYESARTRKEIMLHHQTPSPE